MFRTRRIQMVTLWGAVCNLVLAAFKMVVGTVGNSAAMVADAVHSLSDLVSDVIVIVFAHISSKGQDKGHDYGHGKFETLATLAVSLLLGIVGAKMLSSAVTSIVSCLQSDALPSPSWIALVAAVVSVIVKEALYQWTAWEGKRLSSQVMIANAWHHRTDALSSVGALVGIAGAILFGGKWKILDPAVGGVISIFIIVMAVRMAIPALNELTDASLPEDVENKMIATISDVKGVENVHNLKTRNCGHYFIVEAHIVVDADMTVTQAHDITLVAEERLREIYGNEMQISLHIEPSEDAM